MSHQTCELHTLQPASEPNRCDISNGRMMGNYKSCCSTVHKSLIPSSPPPLLLPSAHLSTPLPSTVSYSLSLADVCSQIPSSGIRCRRSGKNSLGGTGWRKTSRRRFPPVSLHMRRWPSLKFYNQHGQKFVLVTLMWRYTDILYIKTVSVNNI